MANRVAIYIRVSTTYQIDKDSLPMQRKDLIAYSNLILNTDDYVIFEDAGYSGKNTQRPQYQEMMAQIEKGLFTHLLVWKIDRISRNLLDFATMFKHLQELGVTFVSKNEQFDTSTAMGEAMLKIILVFAELERNMTSERVTATMISRAKNGEWNGGRVPYGYDYDPETKVLSLNPDESEIVKQIHDLYLSKKSIIAIARALNNSNKLTRAGNMWNVVSIRLILTSEFYTGTYVYNRIKNGLGDRNDLKNKTEWIYREDHHPAIISKEDKQKVLTLLSVNKRHKGTSHNQRGIVFKQMIICNYCGAHFVAHPTYKKDWTYSNYFCPTIRKSEFLCNSIGVSDAYLGEFVLNYILNMLNAQADFNQINSLWDLQQALLKGSAFSDIVRIDEEGLTDAFNLLASTESGICIYGKRPKIKKKQMPSRLNQLKSEKVKLQRALDRLMNLYLMSSKPLSDTEFLSRQKVLNDQIEELNDQIGMINTLENDDIINDDEFVVRASEFIISKELASRNYICYKRLATVVDASVLQEFFAGIIDNVVVDYGKIIRITFKNGITHSFTYKQEKSL